jgi:hypothetical protein
MKKSGRNPLSNCLLLPIGFCYIISAAAGQQPAQDPGKESALIAGSLRHLNLAQEGKL